MLQQGANYGATKPMTLFRLPAVAKGVVFVGSNDHNVYALNSQTGEKIWSYTTGDSVLSSPAVANDVVYIGLNDYKVYALNAATGSEIWSYKTNEGVESTASVVNGEFTSAQWTTKSTLLVQLQFLNKPQLRPQLQPFQSFLGW